MGTETKRDTSPHRSWKRGIGGRGGDEGGGGPHRLRGAKRKPHGARPWREGGVNIYGAGFLKALEMGGGDPDGRRGRMGSTTGPRHLRRDGDPAGNQKRGSGGKIAEIP